MKKKTSLKKKIWMWIGAIMLALCLFFGDVFVAAFRVALHNNEVNKFCYSVMDKPESCKCSFMAVMYLGSSYQREKMIDIVENMDGDAFQKMTFDWYVHKPDYVNFKKGCEEEI